MEAKAIVSEEAIEESRVIRLAYLIELKIIVSYFIKMPLFPD
tara:strand:+ start:465 stop:590 length:126 start_codon:yes stop_codon:yes gene_type:complete